MERYPYKYKNTEGKEKEGQFINIGIDNYGKRLWEEWQDKVKVFDFVETDRNKDFIYLWDGSRSIWVCLPINGGKFGVAVSGDKDWTYRWKVTREEAIKFLHLSDLHICANASANTGIEARMKYIENHYPEHYIIITGDIIDNEGVVKPGTPVPVNDANIDINNLFTTPPPPFGNVDPHLKVAEKALRNAYNMLKCFQGRIFICPGNHDYGVVGNFYHRKLAEAFDRILSNPLGQKMNPVGGFNPDFAGSGSTHHWHIVKAGNTWVQLFTLDSNLETDDPTDLACGQIGQIQLQVLDAVLSIPNNLPGINQYRILLFHHHPWYRKLITPALLGFPPLPFGVPVSVDSTGLKDSNELLALIKRHPVDYLLFGHKHVEEAPFPNAGVKQSVLAAGSSRHSHFAYEITFPVFGLPVKRKIV